MLLVILFASVALGAPSSLPSFQANAQGTFCASSNPSYLNDLICTIRLQNHGLTALAFAHVNVTISGGETAGAQPALGSVVTTCGNQLTLGRQKTTVDSDQADIQAAGVLTVVSTANYASSGRLYVYTGTGTDPSLRMTYTGITGNSFTGLVVVFNTGGYAVVTGNAVTGTSTGADNVPAQDFINDPTIWDPTIVNFGAEAPQEYVPPPADFIIFQMAVSGNGAQRVIGDISISVDSQLAVSAPICCGCCTPSCRCDVWRFPQSITGPFCDYAKWLASGGYSCSACEIRVTKTWNYCFDTNSTRYGATWETVNSFGNVTPLGSATFTVTELPCTCGTPGGVEAPPCFPYPAK